MSDSPFARVEKLHRESKARLEMGRISRAEFERLLDEAAFVHGGRYWMIGSSTGSWYASEGERWVPATPPPDAVGDDVPPVRAAPRVPVAAPSAAAPVAPASSRTTILWALLVAAPVLSGIGLVMTWRAADEDYEPSDIGTGLILAGVLLAAIALVALLRRLPMVVPLIAAIAWAVAGFAALEFELGSGMDIWWWPDIVMDSGIAAFLGSIVGWWLRRRPAAAR